MNESEASMTPEEAELRKAVKCLTLEVDESICVDIDKKVSAALAAERKRDEKLAAKIISLCTLMLDDLKKRGPR